MKLIGVIKTYNEENNIKRCLGNMTKFCDDIVLYDDGSMDDTVKLAKQYTNNIIKGKKNDFVNEMKHRQILLEKAIELEADWIYWQDADETIEKDATNGGIKELCVHGDTNNIDGFIFHEINLWRSKYWFRIDNQFGDGWFNRLWKNNGLLKYEVKKGLHLHPFPMGLNRIAYANYYVIHYGFSTIEKIANKYKRYIKCGMRPEEFRRFFDENNLTVVPINQNWFEKTVEMEKPLIKMEMKEWQRYL